MQKDDKIVFRAKLDESLANAVRRYVYQIPTFALTKIEILKNDSPLYDETIAHRMGMIPLKNARKPETKFKLKAKGEGYVYSKELKGNLEVVYENIPITFLEKGEEIELTAEAEAGKGTEHSRFSPGIIFYRSIVNLKIVPDCPREIIDICPRNIFEETNGRVQCKNSEGCDLCESCIEYGNKKKKDFVKIEPTDEILMIIESFGQIDSKNILKKSVEILKKDLEEIQKKLK